MSLFDIDLEPKESDHRLTLRMPLWLLKKIDKERKKRIGSVSRNLWILEFIALRLKDK